MARLLPALVFPLFLAPGPAGASPDLERVPFPAAETLEPAVAQQVRGLESGLAALLADPTTPRATLATAFGELGEVFHAYEFWDSASASYRNAQRLASDDYRWHHLLADVCERTGRLDEARRQHEAALAARPGDLPSLVGLGDVCLSLGRLDEAESTYRAALRSAPASPAAHAGLARLAMTRGHFEAARDGFATALSLAPEATRLHYELAMAYRALGDRTSAAGHLAKSGTVGVRVADPLVDGIRDLRRGARTHLVRGRLAFANGRMREAADEFAAAVEAEPRNVSALVGLGAAQAGLGSDEALATFHRALDVDPRNVSAHFNLARLLAARKEWEAAIPHYEAVLAAQPGDAEAADGLAEARARRSARD